MELKLLNQFKANLWLVNHKGDFPIHDAVNSSRKELVKWLLDQRPEAVDYSNNDGRCPLHVAALINNVEMCKFLIDCGASVNTISRNSKGQLMTPMDVAAYKGNRGCAKYIQLRGGVSASKIANESTLKRALTRALTDANVSQDLEVSLPHE